MRLACGSLYDDAEGFGKWEKSSAQCEPVADTNFASLDVVSLKIFILGEPVGRVRVSDHEQASCTLPIDV